MSWGAIVVGAISAGVGIYNASKNRELAEGMAKDAKDERNLQKAELEKQMNIYRSQKIKNPYENMENTFEDLTVNQQAAQFQAQQGAQQRANIMQNLRGAAGGSGVAGLAQALANQGALQTQRISASIGQQEARNQALAAKGAAAVQLAERQGDQFVQQAKMDREATLLGMQMGQTTGANLAYQQAQANEMNAQIAQQQSIANMLEVGGTALGNIDFSNARQTIPTLDSTAGTDYGDYQDYLETAGDDPMSQEDFYRVNYENITGTYQNN